MRITNKIMRNNSLYNLNQNKLLEDKLSNQMTTQSKIARPSDDPVVAIRALRLRSNVTYVTQYYEKNAADADNWMTVTEDSLNTLGTILKNLYEEAASAANKDVTSDDLNIILTQMKSLTKEFYSSGNVDYAGRYIFSGFRTDTAITFSAEDIAEMKEHPTSYNITEQLDFSDIDSFNYTDYSVIDAGGMGPDGMNPDGSGESYEQGITREKIYRFRLSYDDLTKAGVGGLSHLTFKDSMGNDVAFHDAAGNAVTMQEVELAEDAYKEAVAAKERGEAYCAYVPATGEIVFNELFYEANFSEGDSFKVSYDKGDWEEGDIHPAHYFECRETKDMGDGNVKTTVYNTEATTLPQDIYYDVGFNQKIQVNTQAEEVFTHDVKRDMDDFQRCFNMLQDIETTISDITKKRAEFPEDSDEYKDWTRKLEAAERAQSYIREDIHTQFENQISKYQKYMDDNNIAITNNASRRSRLDLISNRLMGQQETFKELQTDNESIDVTQVATELSSSELTYEAALMATGKIMQTNLMNYI